jgi:hypothetical protein
VIVQVIDPGRLFLHPSSRDAVRVPEDRFAICCACGAVVWSPVVRGRDAAEQLRRNHALGHQPHQASPDALVFSFPSQSDLTEVEYLEAPVVQSGAR